jgi:hypothetical protein
MYPTPPTTPVATKGNTSKAPGAKKGTPVNNKGKTGPVAKKGKGKREMEDNLKGLHKGNHPF